MGKYVPLVRVKLTTNGRWWQAWWRLPGKKRERRSMGARDLVTYEQALADTAALERHLNLALAAAAPEPPTVAAPAGPPLGDLLAKIRERRSSDLSHGTKAIDALTHRLLVEHFMPTRDVATITRDDVDAWRVWLVDRLGEAPDPLTAAKRKNTAAKHVRRAKSAFAYALELRLTTSNPFAGARNGGVVIDLPKPTISVETIRALLDETPDPRWRALIALCYFAGVRKHEAAQLPWTSIDWARRRILVISRKVEGGGFRTREALMEPELERILLEVREHTGTSALVCGDLSTRSYNCACAELKSAVTRASIKTPITFQLMRSSRENLWLAEGHPANVVTSWLGHSPTIAAKHYRAVPESAYQARTSKISDATNERGKDLEIKRLRKELAKVQREIRKNASGQFTRNDDTATRAAT